MGKIDPNPRQARSELGNIKELEASIEELAEQKAKEEAELGVTEAAKAVDETAAVAEAAVAEAETTVEAETPAGKEEPVKEEPTTPEAKQE